VRAGLEGSWQDRAQGGARRGFGDGEECHRG
jgi:hypothetical protein